MPLRMFVRFRQTSRRLQVSLIETRRIAGRVRHEHVASLGTIDISVAVPARIAFWEVLHVRMRKLHNRLDGATYAKVLGAVHSRIPMVTADEQVALQTENAEVEAQFWSQVRDFHAEQIKGQGQLAATASDLIAEGRTAMTDAATRADCAQDRVERLRRGENLSGGLGEPLDVVALLKQEGFTTADLRHAEQLHALGGGDLFQDYLTEFLKRRAASERRTSYAAQRAVLRRHGR